MIEPIASSTEVNSSMESLEGYERLQYGMHVPIEKDSESACMKSEEKKDPQEESWEEEATVINRSISAKLGEDVKGKWEECSRDVNNIPQSKADASTEGDTVGTEGGDKVEEHGLEYDVALLKSSDQRSGQGVIAGDRYFAPSSGEGQGKAEKGNSIANIQV
uniref:Uncharacterized protein n=1 Tax=Chromera velia CCMP2878 TaxID=1169474 RepID=A0A0G4GTK6_9ALVE|eukprot:Cvel_5189.t1-p1 / transcript=Cvel_5189.t1 / gene=Cvel_5189 / organism=Chromera_velia_CCMP2878 / gene_product=hypothetical protein / transcript_product=hypothetical protein / location=Cvel_scaffold238:88806-89288(+) / protein_length=161 / sequence_SO=supercontig / SO=protein_coding / is_pseudo=false